LKEDNIMWSFDGYIESVQYGENVNTYSLLINCESNVLLFTKKKPLHSNDYSFSIVESQLRSSLISVSTDCTRRGARTS
jgi:hypothetical protein